jgi:hypothetical protein
VLTGRCCAVSVADLSCGRARNWNVRHSASIVEVFFFLMTLGREQGVSAAARSAPLVTRGRWVWTLEASRDANAASSIPCWNNPVTTMGVSLVYPTQCAGREDEIQLSWGYVGKAPMCWPRLGRRRNMIRK